MIQAASPETETPLDLQDPLALLTVGVRIAPVDTKKMGTFVHSGWTCVCYPTTAEATRRAALLTMLTCGPMRPYNPMRQRLQPHVPRLQPPCVRGCSSVCKRLQALCAQAAAPMYQRLQPPCAYAAAPRVSGTTPWRCAPSTA